MLSTVTSDTRLRDELLADPAVQDALVRAGRKAMSDPAVQEQILRAAEAKGPQAAEAAASKLSEWVSDPDVQSWARARAVEAASGAAVMAANGPARLVGLIEQGPTGVRWLAFCVGALSAARSVFDVLQVWHILAPVAYLISCYQLLFGLIIMLLEADPVWLMGRPTLNRYQDFLIENAKMLTHSYGRGAFYVFMALLMLGSDFGVSFLVALALLLVGALHWAMHFGIMPHHFAQKVRDGGAMAAHAAAAGVDKARELAARHTRRSEDQQQTGADTNEV